MADPMHDRIKKRIVLTVEEQEELGIEIFYGIYDIHLCNVMLP